MREDRTDAGERSAATQQVRAYAAHWLGYVAYPLLLVATGAVVYYALAHALPLGPVTFGTVIGSILYLALLERIIPYRRSWHPTGREWRRDGVYFSMNFVMGGLAQAAMSTVTVRLASAEQRLPLWLEAGAALLVSTFCTYWFHRLGHILPWLWKVHGVHHVPAKVNLANNNVVQIVDTFGANLVPALPLLLFGFSEPAVFMVSVFAAVQGYGSHCNADVRLGWLNYILCGPEQHRLHHGLELEQAGHFGVDVSIWDHVFGSFRWRPGKQPGAVGVVHPHDFPPEHGILANQLHPFRRARARSAAPAIASSLHPK